METRYYTHEIPTPDSSVLSRVLYNMDTKEMFVFFHHSNIPAGYRDVPTNLFDELRHDSSPGRWYLGNIKGVYPGIDTGNLTFEKASPKTKVVPIPKQIYRVSYTHTDYATVSAESFDDAVRIVKDSNSEVKVTGVTIVE